ncbi:MAG: NADH-quinone oxidoreductase subunit A [Acidobacteriota bacterium]
METYFGFLLLLLFAGGTAGAMLALHHWLGPRRSGQVHDAPFECGKEPVEILRGRVSVKFFLVALLFILFDVELVFLFPWAIVYRELGWFGFGEMAVFLLVVLAGLFYSVQRGALEWR